MKKYFLLSVLYLFILQPVGATGCDSIVVKVSRSFSSYSGWTTSVVSYTFNDGLLRIFRGPYNEITYYYDSLNRESEAINSQNGTINSKNVHYYSSVTGSDTAAIAFRFNGQNYYYSSGQFYFYDANQNLQMTVFENYDTLSMQWDTTSYELSFYSPDSLTRMDTVYSYPGNSVVYYDATTWDSLGRVISSSSYGGLSWGSSSIIYDTLCTSGISYAIYDNTLAGPGGSDTHDYSSWYYDSLCRPVHVIDSVWIFPNNPQLPYMNLKLTDYYYADCNTIVVAGMDTVVTCPNQPVALSLSAYGGTGPLSFSWISSDSLSDHSVLNPVVYTNSGSICQLTVTDSLGNNAQFQTVVAVNYFTAAVTNASCDTCGNGSVTIQYPPVQAYCYLSVSPNDGSWNGTTLSGLHPGDYKICSRNGSCTYCDSVHVLSPTSVGEIGQENFIHVSPNPAVSSLLVTVDSGHRVSTISWIMRSIDGRILNRNSENQSQFVVPVESLAKGIYFLEIMMGSSNTIKIIKD